MPTRSRGTSAPPPHAGPPARVVNEGAQIFRRYLAGQNLKMTQERREILQEVFSSPEHFGADELHLRFVHKKVPVSRATIYRTLEHLVKSGLVRRVYLDQKKAFFEHVYGRKHHEHMICLSCGKVIEFSDDPLEERQDKVCRDHRFKPLRHSLRIVGLCSSCQ
ncbi:MAG TPA: transcriptional repressor [Candidatus Polarisedimenticolia bacterium]|nr:transcriptional repressor [Candidatus Polarisedimenticolia bacterium]